MKSLFERLKELVFKNTDIIQHTNFFTQATPDEMEQLKKEGIQPKESQQTAIDKE